MSLAITMNLIAIVVVVGWAVAVWAFHKHLSDPYARPAARRQQAAVQDPAAGSQPGTAPSRARALAGAAADAGRLVPLPAGQ